MPGYPEQVKVPVAAKLPRATAIDRDVAGVRRAAEVIGARLVRSAVWDGNRCTWKIAVPDYSSPGTPATSTFAGPSLYQGSAGIALFLVELHRATGDSALLAAARGALRHARAVADDRMPATAVFTGRVGLAWVHARLAEVTGDAEATEAAVELVRGIAGHETADRSLDVIGGAAGAIPVLLRLAQLLDMPDAVISAHALGDQLLRTARRWPEGWSWSPYVAGQARDLTGYAHGAAGIGAGLLELWAASGLPAYRYAAEQAFAYEMHFVDPATGNWLDLRNPTLGEAQRDPSSLAALRSMLREGQAVPAYQPHSIVAWCHGAPGITMTRARASVLLRLPVYAAATARGARVTIERIRRNSIQSAAQDYSLCHGSFGACEALLIAADALGEPDFAQVAADHIEEAVAGHRNGDAEWASGAWRGAPDPSLMLGEAGIGHFLLRITDPATPSILFLTGPESRPSSAAIPEADSVALQRLRMDDVERYFGGALRALRWLRIDAADVAVASAVQTAPAPVIAASGVIEDLVNGEGPDESTSEAGDAADLLGGEQARTRSTGGTPTITLGATRDLIEDCTRVDRARYDATRGNVDFGAAFCHDLGRTPASEIAWEREAFRLSAHAQLVTSRWDWDALTASGSPEAPAILASSCAEPVTYVVYRTGDQFTTARLGALAEATLSALADAGRNGRTVADLVESIAPSCVVIESPEARTTLRAHLAAQLRTAYTAGVVAIA